MSDEGGQVTKRNSLCMQVCVPAGWTDEEVKAFAEHAYPCGTEHGWQIRKAGDKRLHGDPVRAPCTGLWARPGCVHIMLDA